MSTKHIEALKLALEGAANYIDALGGDSRKYRQALAEQPAQPQEPVAVVSGYYGGQCVILPIDPARIFNSNTALYTSTPAQRTWVGLTDEQWQSIADTLGCIITRGQKDAIEAKLKEKNA